MRKRGLIELHFNWIFILIAGAIIFIFFINIINKQREFSELKTSGTIITNLESILTGAQVSTNTVNIIDMPKVNIGFECNRYFIGAVPKQTKGNVIFSPSLLKGKEIITWALDWNMPYRVTNFLYITDPQLRYIIIDKANTPGEKIKEDLKEMNIDITTSTIISDKNNYKVKFIFFSNFQNEVLNDFSNMPDEDVTGIVITAEFTNPNIIPSTGTIQFIKKNGNTWQPDGSPTFYLKKESLFGAIFAADSEMYNCVMKKAFKKLSLVSEIYSERSLSLANQYVLNNCNSPHIQAQTQINNLQTTAEEESETFPERGIDRMNAMLGYNNNIKSENQRAQLFSCALIY